MTTKGFRDLLHIGNQSRPYIFDLEIAVPDVLYDQVLELDEQVGLCTISTSYHPSSEGVQLLSLQLQLRPCLMLSLICAQCLGA